MSDIRADLEAAAKELEGKTEEEAEVDETAPTPEPDQPTPAESEAGSETEAEAQEAEKQVSAEPAEEDPEPTTWAAEMRQHWKSLPPDVRKYISEREKQQHAYISRIGGEHGRLRKDMGDIDEALKPFEPELKQAGVTKGQAVKQLIAERAQMLQDPVSFVKRFADLHKIDLVNLAVDSDMSDPPEVRRARWEVQERERQLQQQQQTLEQQQQEAAKEQLVQFVESWGSQKPHFGSVRQAMAQILPEIQQSYPYLTFAEQLDATYNAALKHPSFAHLTKPKTVPPAVKKAASGVAGVSGAPTPQPEPTSIREALIQAAKETGFI